MSFGKYQMRPARIRDDFSLYSSDAQVLLRTEHLKWRGYKTFLYKIFVDLGM